MKTAFRQLSVAPAMLLALSILDCQLPTAYCQGTAFTYQGQLQNNGGPASGTYNMTFSVFNTNASGVAIAGPVTNNDVGVSNGLFTVRIDFGPGVFTGEANWLEIGVETNGGSAFTTLTPRQELTPVPYALFANTSSNVSGPVSTAQLSGTVLDSQLAHSAVTLNAGPGLSGGGRVGLGNAITLTNTGVLGVSGNADITATNVGGAVTLGDTGTSADTANLLVKRDGSGNFSAGSITLAGNLTLPATTATAGVIYSGGETLVQAYGTQNFFAGTAAGNLALSGSANTGVGYLALFSDTTGSENTALGDFALRANTNGAQNTATGYAALYSNTKGSQNTADGFAALDANTSGSENTAVGFAALDDNTNGYQNTATGFQALLANTSGAQNTAIGGEALESNTNGYDNTATGYEALFSNTSGSDNTAVGAIALLDNTSGYGNTANGYAALYYNTTGAQNTAIGIQTLYNNTNGSENTAVGDEALDNNLSGNFNTAAGDGALFSGTTASGNTAVGAFTLYSITKASNNTATGTFALEGFRSGADNTADGYGAGGNQVGGGNTAVGSEAFEGIQDIGDALNNNTAIGAKTLDNLQTGDNNTALGWKSLYNLTNGGHNIAVGYEASQNVLGGNNNIEIGNAGSATDSGNIAIGVEGTQTTTAIAGIYGAQVSGATATTVYVDNTGHLGTVFVTVRPLPGPGGDENARVRREPVDTRTVLEGVAAMPINRWHYTNDLAASHLGPVARDFRAAFNVGEENQQIAAADEEGVALAAIQGLNQKVEAEKKEADAEMAKLKVKADKVDSLERQNELLAQRLNELEATVKLLAARK